MPTLDFASGQTRYYKVIRAYDGDTLTIQTPQNRTVSLRLVGVDTPELNASNPDEKRRAIAARDYLRALVLNKHIFITFEKSDTTLDGIARGPFCRPLSYIFIRKDNRNIFVNLEIVWQGHGRKYFKYDFAYQDFFRLNQITARQRINALTLTAPVQQSPSRKRRLSTVWAGLKKVREIP